MGAIGLALGFAIFVWWFSTGIVIMLNRMSKSAVRLSLGLSSLLGVGALLGLAHTADQSDMAGHYCAFTCALLAWGWNELSFLTGWITGPQKTAISPQVQGWPRLVASTKAVIWHELGILLVGVSIVAITWGEVNQVGTSTYLVLWLMRTSAKFNLFLGVRNLSEQFLPTHLAYLQSFFRRRRMNAFFPFALALAALYWLSLIDQVRQPSVQPAEVVGLVLVATLLALAILEHLMLVLPFDPTVLWQWALRKPAALPSALRTEPAPAQEREAHDASYSAH